MRYIYTFKFQIITIFIIAILFINNKIFSQSTIQVGTTQLEADTIAEGIDVPWEILFHDGYVWFTERRGTVNRVNVETKTKTEILDITSTVFQEAESGLLGMALHPDFNNTPEVFLVYTYGSFSNIKERLVKYTFDGTSLSNEVILLDNIIGNTTHDGSRLLFLPDNTLLMTTGDAQSTNLPQNTSSLSGKVLRINTDGSIPSDNPIMNSYVYSYGHRNAQGMAFSPSGKIFISEHGPSTDDEFQELVEGANYGWPNVEGFCDQSFEENFCNENTIQEPLIAWTPTIAPSDLIYYSNADFPEWNNKFIMTVLKNKQVIAIELDATEENVLSQTQYLNNQFGRLRDICIGSENEIYIATNGSSWSNIDPFTHNIIRLKVKMASPVQNIASLDEVSLEIFPNPIQNEAQISCNTTFDKIMIYDNLGRLVYDYQFENTMQKNIELDTLSSGIYFCNIQLDNQFIATQKIIIE